MRELKAKIENALGAFWDERIVLKVPAAAGTTSVMEAALDSLSASEVLMEIDDLVSAKVPAETVIRQGGYETREQFIVNLTAAVLKHVQDNAP